MAASVLHLSPDDTDFSTDGYFKEKTLSPGQGHDWLGHHCGILTLVVHGHLEEGFDWGRQSCSSWELHYKPPGVVHTTKTGPEGARMLLLGLRAPALARLDLEVGREPRALGGGVRAARALTLFAELDFGRRGPRVLEGEPLRRLLENPGPVCADEARPKPCWITEVRERVIAAPQVDAGLGRLADEFRVHPVYLARAFRTHYGESIGEARRALLSDNPAA